MLREFERHLDAGPLDWREVPLPELAVRCVLNVLRAHEIDGSDGVAVLPLDARNCSRLQEVLDVFEEPVVRVRLARLERLAWRLRFEPVVGESPHGERPLRTGFRQMSIVSVDGARIATQHDDEPRAGRTRIAPSPCVATLARAFQSQAYVATRAWRALQVGTVLQDSEPPAALGVIGTVAIGEAAPHEAPHRRA